MIKGAFFLEPIEENIIKAIIEAGVNEISLKWEYYNQKDASGKTLQLGMFAVPWTEDAFGNAIRSIVCQDFRSLSKHIDLFGVMTYHGLTEQPLEWIRQVTEKMTQITGKSVVPLIQSIDIPVTISGEEFRKSIEVAVGEPSKGVIVFHFHDLLENASKYGIMKNEFRAR